MSREGEVVQRLKRYWGRFRSARFRFHAPRQAAILIYDGTGRRHLLPLLHPHQPEILFTRGEEVNVPLLLRALLAVGRFSEAYEDLFIRAVDPTLILTFIDNSVRFYGLSARHPTITTMFVQNGWRGGTFDVFHAALERSSAAVPRRVDVMCTYGEAISAEYRRYIAGETVIIGSLLSNRYPVRIGPKHRRIAYISQYDEQNAFGMPIADLVLRALTRYAESRQVPLVVVARSTDPAEARYFDQLLGDRATFRSRIEGQSSYEYLDECEVAVAIDSSLAYEVAARGTKTAFFTITGHYLECEGFNFGWPAPYPHEGPFWSNYPDPAKFDRILDYLFGIDDAEWRAVLDSLDYASLVAPDPGNTKFKSIIEHALRLGERSVDKVPDRRGAYDGART